MGLRGTHPEWNHGGEVEGRDPGTDPQGLSVGVGVHVLGNGAEGLPQLEVGDRAGMLHHLWRGGGRRAGKGRNLD